MSSQGPVDSDGAETAGTCAQKDYVQEGFDTLLHPNELEALVDFDFSYDDLGIADTDVASPSSLASPSTTGRRQNFSPTHGRNINSNAEGKVLPDMSASALAGAWGAATASPVPAGAFNSTSTSTSGKSTSAYTNLRCSSESNVAHRTMPSAPSSVAAGAAPDHPVNQTNASSVEDGVKDHKVRRAAAGAGSKRPLNPGRMERKASREKRRREEVNDRFDQLLRVLEEAEATSGLEPPIPTEGQAAMNACINGRRVEVLSRTIAVLKKLLRERRQFSLDSTQDVGCTSNQGHGDKTTVDCGMGSGLSEPKADRASTTGGNIVNTAAATGSTQTPSTQHVAVPVHGHASLSMPPGFVGVPQVGMPHGTMSAAGVPNGLPGQPIFIALPMYMPPGQGVPSVDGQGQTPVPAAPAPATDNAPGPRTGENVGDSVEGAKKWAILPPGVGFQSMVPLQMPQFVTQVLATDDGDEKPTHAVCA